MKVIYDIGKFHQKITRPVVAIGVFDGVHIGHRSIIRRMIQKAKSIKGKSVVVTFYPHPTHVLHAKSSLLFLSTLEYRLKLIEAMGVDYCFVIRFTSEFSALTPQEFITQYLVKKLNPQDVFVGYNFHFGHNRAGNPKLLKTLGLRNNFETHVIARIKSHQSTVSSSCIRKLIHLGRLDLAQKFLGRIFSVVGNIEGGDRRGRALGFPTVNVTPSSTILPPRGVYAVEVLLDKKTYKGIANVGVRPSFKRNNRQPNVEVHILDFSRDVYGQEIEIKFIQKIRKERKFLSPQRLIEQIQKDIIIARRFLSQ